MSNMPPDAFKSDPGIRELCSIRRTKGVQIWNLGYEPIEQYNLAKWLKGEQECPREEGENEKGLAGEIEINELGLPE